MKDRLEHIGLVESLEFVEDSRYARWEETRLERWLVDWLLRYGKEKTAISIAQEKGIDVRYPSQMSRAPNSRRVSLWWI